MTFDTGRVAAVFDDWAARGRAEGMERGHAHAAQVGFESLAVGPGATYLDIGCGNGYSVRWAAAHAPDVEAVGIDVSANMVARAREQSEAFPNARFIHGDFPAAAAELAHAHFDAIFSMEVFYYLPDLEGALAATARLLAPAGRFACIVDHYTENTESHSWAADVGLPLHLKSEDEWKQLFLAAGFTKVTHERIRAESVEGEPDTWKQLEGSLLTLGVR